MKIREYFEPFIAYMQSKGRDPKTLVEHRRFLEGPIGKTVGDIELSNLKKIDTALIEAAGRGYGEYGPLRAIVSLRRLLNYIEDRGEVIPFPWRNVSLPKAPPRPIEALDMDELEVVMARFDTNTTIGLRTRVLFEFIFCAGLRISEALNIKRNDIDIAKKEISITNIKTKAKETVYLTDRCLYWLKLYMEKRTDIYDYIFTTHNGRLHAGSARRNLQSYTVGLDFKKHIKPHLFRKTFTTHLLKEKVNIKDVQHLSRHKSERTTLKYYAAVNLQDAKIEHQRVMGALTVNLCTAQIDSVRDTGYIITKTNISLCPENEKRPETEKLSYATSVAKASVI